MSDIQSKGPFGEYIRKKRLEAGLTQKELAGQLYVAESTVSKWERGLSYPDISMVPSVCAALNISEHEFFTACDDENARLQAREAGLWRQRTKRLRLLGKRLRRFFAAGYAAALLACFICDLAIFHTLDWFWIVLTAVMTAFCLTNLPAMVRKNRLPVCLGAATGSLALLLLACWLYAGDRWVLGGAAIAAVCLALPWSWWAIWRFYGRHVPPLCLAASSAWVFLLLPVIHAFTGGGWLWSLGFPVAALGTGCAWLYFAVIYWLPLGTWLKAALCVLLSAFAVPLVNALIAPPGRRVPVLAGYFACLPIREDVSGISWVNALVFAVLLAASAVLLVVGIILEVRRRKQRAR